MHGEAGNVAVTRQRRRPKRKGPSAGDGGEFLVPLLHEGVGVEHIGFDVREVLVTAKEIIDAQRADRPVPVRVVRPRFKNELMSFAKVESDA